MADEGDDSAVAWPRIFHDTAAEIFIRFLCTKKEATPTLHDDHAEPKINSLDGPPPTTQGSYPDRNILRSNPRRETDFGVLENPFLFPRASRAPPRLRYQDRHNTLRPSPHSEEDFDDPTNPFPFSPGQSRRLLDPKSLDKVFALSGLTGLEKSSRRDRTCGPGLDEERRMSGAVSFEDATGSLGEAVSPIETSSPFHFDGHITPVRDAQGKLADESLACAEEQVFDPGDFAQFTCLVVLCIAWNLIMRFCPWSIATPLGAVWLAIPVYFSINVAVAQYASLGCPEPDLVRKWRGRRVKIPLYERTSSVNSLCDIQPGDCIDLKPNYSVSKRVVLVDEFRRGCCELPPPGMRCEMLNLAGESVVTSGMDKNIEGSGIFIIFGIKTGKNGGLFRVASTAYYSIRKPTAMDLRLTMTTPMLETHDMGFRRSIHHLLSVALVYLLSFCLARLFGNSPVVGFGCETVWDYCATAIIFSLIFISRVSLTTAIGAAADLAWAIPHLLLWSMACRVHDYLVTPLHQLCLIFSTVSSMRLSSRRLVHTGGRSTRARMFEVRGSIEGRKVVANVDSGASFNLISKKLARSMGLEPLPGTRGEIILPTGSTVSSPGQVKARFQFAGEDEAHDILCAILPNATRDLVLGNPFLKKTETLTRHAHRLIKVFSSSAGALCLNLAGGEHDFLRGWLHGRECLAVPDTGSDITAISRAFAAALGLKVHRKPRHRVWVRFLDGSEARTDGLVRASWQFRHGEEPLQCEFHVLGGLPVSAILGNGMIDEFGVFSRYRDRIGSAEEGWRISGSKIFAGGIFGISLVERYKAEIRSLSESFIDDGE